MLKKIRIVCIFTAITLILGCISASAEPVNIDAFLISAGFPQELVNKMSNIQKELIYEQSVGKDVEFCGYDKTEFVITDEGALVESSAISPRWIPIEPTDMTLSVFGVRVYVSTGDIYYTVYPSFKWHSYKKVANDTFAMSMYPGWEAIPGERNFRLHLLNNNGQSVQYVDIAPSSAVSTGYSFKIPSNTGFMQALYAGYAYFNLDKVSTTASPRISLYYAHDASTSLNASYGISIGYGNISITGNTDKIYTMSDNFEVEGLAQ